MILLTPVSPSQILQRPDDEPPLLPPAFPSQPDPHSGLHAIRVHLQEGGVGRAERRLVLGAVLADGVKTWKEMVLHAT